MDNINNYIASHIKEYRKSKNLSQDISAERMGISTRHYNSIEAGNDLPSSNSMLFMHETSDFNDIDFLITGVPSNESVFSRFVSCYKNDYSKLCSFYSFLTSLLIDANCNFIFPYIDCVHTPCDEKNIHLANNRISQILTYEIKSERYKNVDEFAHMLAVSTSTLARYKKGESLIHTECLYRIYKEFKWTPSYLLYADINSSSHFDRCFSTLSPSKQNVILEILDLYVQMYH